MVALFAHSSKKQNTKKDFFVALSFDRLSFVDSLARARGRCAAETGRALHVRSPPAQHAACPATFQPASTASCPRTAACCNAVRSPAKPTSHPTHAQLHIHERRGSRAACSRRAARVPHSDPSKVKTRASPAPSSPLPSPCAKRPTPRLQAAASASAAPFAQPSTLKGASMTPPPSPPAALRRPRVCEPSGGAPVRSCSRGPRLRDSRSRSPGRTGVPPVPRRRS